MKTKQLCRWLGPVHGIGQELFSYIFLDLGKLILSSSVISIENLELTPEHMKQLCEKFMTNVESESGNSK